MDGRGSEVEGGPGHGQIRPPARPRETPCTGVRYASILAGQGYGDAAVAYLSGLRDAAVPVTWTPMIPGSGTWAPDRSGPFTGRVLSAASHGDICNAAVPYDTLVLHMPPWFFPPWLEEGLDVATVGMMAWEMDVAPRSWRPALDALDLVVVPSTFNHKVLVASGTPTPVEVVPHIARPVRPAPGAAYGPITERDFVFYTIGAWSARRAVADTIRAFLDTFTSADEVALVVKTGAHDHQAVRAQGLDHSPEVEPHTSMAWWSVARILADYPHPAKLFLLAEDVPLAVIDQLHTRGDCYVSLSRGEGWGLGSFDAALFANPAIVTGWGGVLDYLGADYPLLVDYELVPTSRDAPDGAVPQDAHDETTHWAHADRAHAGSLMAWVYEHRDQAAQLGRDLRPALTSRYSSATVTAGLIDLLDGLRR